MRIINQRSRTTPVIAFCAALTAIGCGSNRPSTPLATHANDQLTCGNDPRAQPVAAGFHLAGSKGLYTFTIVSLNPAPPAVGSNSWGIHLTDNAKNLVSDANVSVSSFMPDHGHGSSVAPQVSQSATTYNLNNLYLFMPGIWQVTVSATSAGQSDSAVFSFCVAG